jgi:hypothetical protein
VSQTGNDVSEVTSRFYMGQRDDESFVINSDSLDSSGSAQINFPNTTIVNTLYQTPRADFILTLPLGDLPLNLRLSYADISGFIEVDEIGFQMTEGIINGYLTEETILTIMSGISSSCARPEAPSLCDSLGSFLTGVPENDATLLTAILGGYDVSISPEGQPSTCSGPSCNALSVCLQIEMSSVTITGVSD